MNIVKTEELEALLSTTDFDTFFPEHAPKVSEEMMAHPVYGKDLKICCLVDYPSEELMTRYSKLQLYYSRFYYNLKFAEKYKLVNGPASDMDQMVFKVWESGDYITDFDVDWEYVEGLRNEVLTELGLPGVSE